MGNMIKATVRIRGTRPHLWNHFSVDMLGSSDGTRKAKSEGSAGNDPTEWQRNHLVTPDGRLYDEPTYIFGCIREGAKHTKKGRGSIQPTVSATLQVLDDEIVFNRNMPASLTQDRKEPVYLDVRGVNNPKTRAKNVRYRIAASPGWETEFTIMWDRTLVSVGEMRAVLNDAGNLVGIGDGRAIGFGRFEVIGFETDGA